MPPLISFITITKDDPRGLARTIASVSPLKSDPLIEFILVDGNCENSPQSKTLDVFYDKDRIIQGQDSGIYDAMNKGAMLASGKYLIFLNSGDEFLQKKIRLVSAVLQKTSVSMVSYSSNIVSESGDVIMGKHKPNFDLEKLSVPHQSTFYLAETFKKMGGYYPNLRYSGDYDLNIRLLLDRPNDNLIIDEVVSNFFTGGVSYSPKALIESRLVEFHHGLMGLTGLISAVVKIRIKFAIKRLVDSVTISSSVDI